MEDKDGIGNEASEELAPDIVVADEVSDTDIGDMNDEEVEAKLAVESTFLFFSEVDMISQWLERNWKKMAWPTQPFDLSI